MINQLFGGSATNQVVTFVGYGPYTFAYQDSPGNPGYVQNQPASGPYSATGDVSGH